MISRLLATCALILSTCSLAALTHDGAQDDVETSVRRAIQDCPHVTIFDDVHVTVDDGVVVLEGKVTAASKRTAIEQQVARVSGVRQLRNSIAVLPPIRQDEELRRRVARAIYGHASFWSYAAMTRPPIHIIVERGEVWLKGTVATTAEKTTAGTLASGLGAHRLVNELRPAR
jgi:osmotically-inducible protein OsmY